MPPDPVPPGRPEGETLARFAVMLAAHRGQIGTLRKDVDRLREDLDAMTTASPKGPPMIAWQDLSDQEAAAVRADLSTWVTGVLFRVYPSARESVRDCWDRHPDALVELSAAWLEFRRIFAAPRPGLADSLAYLDRWLPGCLKRVRAITERCAGMEGHQLPPG